MAKFQYLSYFLDDKTPIYGGDSGIDIIKLNDLTIGTASRYLNQNSGSMIMKTFQNNKLKGLRKKMELSFKTVQTFKPAASKKQSGEIFLYGANR